ncbi:MAG: hypothetical protein ACTSR8_19760 [Promethearchaeota archaeon]
MSIQEIRILRKRMKEDRIEEYLIQKSRFLFHNKKELIEFSDIKDDVFVE